MGDSNRGTYTSRRGARSLARAGGLHLVADYLGFDRLAVLESIQIDLPYLRRGYLQETTLENGGLLAENLEAVARALHDEDPVFVIDFYRNGPLESLLTFVQTLG